LAESTNKPNWNSSLCSLLQPLSHHPSLSGPNILLSTPFSNTLNLCSSLKTGDKISHQFKNKSKTISDTSGSHGGEYKDGCLLGCCTALSGRNLPTFQKRLLLPSSGRLKVSTSNIGKLSADYTAPTTHKTAIFTQNYSFEHQYILILMLLDSSTH
jgi:hypothetical protein